MISETIQAKPQISGSDLAKQLETIKLVTEFLSTDDLANLWDSLFKVEYRLSFALQANTILLNNKQEIEPMPMSKYEEEIKESIMLILNIPKGKRVTHPDFGCGIHEPIFHGINATNMNSMETTVREALVSHEPRIEVIAVNVFQEQDQIGKILISIDYRVKLMNNQYNLVYPIFLGQNE